MVNPKVKNKIYLFVAACIIALAHPACEKIPDGVVDIKSVEYKVNSINAPSSYVYSSDSTFVVFVAITNPNTVKAVWLSLKSEDGKDYIAKQTTLQDDGLTNASGDQKINDGVYTGKVKMSKKYSSGRYLMEFFVEDNIRSAEENVTKIGEQVFVYDNVQKNLAPSISNLVLPSSVIRGTSFNFSIKVEDPNGLNDISIVYFKLYRPDGTIVIPNSSSPEIDYFAMVDNGDQNLGDQTAGDGVYSFKNSFGSTSALGNWKFLFRAKDKSGALSNTLEQNVGVN